MKVNNTLVSNYILLNKIEENIQNILQINITHANFKI
jgi:hypothetical protein